MKIVYPKGSIQLISTGDTRGTFDLWCNGNVVYSFRRLTRAPDTGEGQIECTASGICPIDGLGDFVKGDIWYQLTAVPVEIYDSHFLVFRTEKFTVEWEIHRHVYWESFPPHVQQMLNRQR